MEESGGNTMKDRGVDLCVGGLGGSVPPTVLRTSEIEKTEKR